MTRAVFIERLRRQVYGDFPSDDSTITDNLVNQWVNDGCGIAAKKNYTDNLQLEGVGFLNNSFYSTFKGLPITQDEQFLYKTTLPQIPLGIGDVTGISRVLFKDASGNISYPGVILNENQVGIARQMRAVPNKILCYPEGEYCYAITTLLLHPYTMTVTMVSGGDQTNLDSTLNIPDDYISILVEYIKAQLSFERQQISDQANDGVDAIRQT